MLAEIAGEQGAAMPAAERAVPARQKVAAAAVEEEEEPEAEVAEEELDALQARLDAIRQAA